MSVTMYLLYDGELKFAMEDDPSQFKKVEETTVFSFDVGEQINWMVSSLDTQLEKIKVKDKKKIAGMKPVKGNWKDIWTEKPKNVTQIHCQGTPYSEGATVENPMVFAFDIIYKTKDGKDELTIDPGGWAPSPAPDPPLEPNKG
ncbi:MAG: hypothetical protein AB8B73_14430 [Ekhidna sp.]